MALFAPLSVEHAYSLTDPRMGGGGGKGGGREGGGRCPLSVDVICECIPVV